MPRPSAFLTLLPLATALVIGCAAPQARFGEDLRLSDAEAIPAPTVLKNAPAYDGRFIRVTGEVVSICESKGCWIRLAGEPGGETLFVKLSCPIGEDERLIPMEALGKQAVVEGTLEVGEITESAARHFAEESGKSAEEVAKITGPQPTVMIQSPAILIKGIAQPETSAAAG